MYYRDLEQNAEKKREHDKIMRERAATRRKKWTQLLNI